MKRIDFYEKYPSAKKDDNILALFDHNKKEEYIEKRDIKLKSELDAIKRYKYLIRKEFDLTITPREEKELFFILKNFGEGSANKFKVARIAIKNLFNAAIILFNTKDGLSSFFFRFNNVIKFIRK